MELKGGMRERKLSKNMLKNIWSSAGIDSNVMKYLSNTHYVLRTLNQTGFCMLLRGLSVRSGRKVKLPQYNQEMVIIIRESVL